MLDDNIVRSGHFHVLLQYCGTFCKIAAILQDNNNRRIMFLCPVGSLNRLRRSINRKAKDQRDSCLLDNSQSASDVSSGLTLRDSRLFNKNVAMWTSTFAGETDYYSRALSTALLSCRGGEGGEGVSPPPCLIRIKSYLCTLIIIALTAI